MDGCARAKRWDLIEHYLWRMVNRLNMKVSAGVISSVCDCWLPTPLTATATPSLTSLCNPHALPQPPPTPPLQATPAMQFLMLKAASLRGDLDTAAGLARNLSAHGEPVELMHHVALVSAAAAAGKWDDAFKHFNGIRRRGMVPPASLWATLLRALHAAGRAEECHYVWVAMSRTSALKAPASLYAQVRCSKSVGGRG